MKPLLWKELRENVRWLPVGLIVVGFACWIAPPNPNDSGGLLANDLLMQLAIVMPLLAFALGVVQSYRDLQPGPASYLNHRGVTASQIFLAKTISGFVLFATSVIIPVAVLAAWVWYGGIMRYPMRPAQVIPSLAFALASFMVHPAAMLMMCRNASWWGTRLLPLVPACSILLWILAALESGGSWGAMVVFMMTVPVLAWLIAISHQGWQDLATDPPASRVNAMLRERWLLPTYLILGVASGCSMVQAFIVITIDSYATERDSAPTPFQQLVLDQKTGEPWLTTRLQIFDRSTRERGINVLGGDAIKSGATVNAMKPLGDPSRMRPFDTIEPLAMSDIGGDGFFSSMNFIKDGLVASYDQRGFVHLYESYFEHGSLATIATDGVYPPGDISGVPFTSDPLVGGWVLPHLQGRFMHLIDSQAVYLLGTAPLSITRLIDKPIESAGMVNAEQARRLLLRSGLEIFEYQTVDDSGTDTQFMIPNSEQRDNRGVNQKLNAGPSISAKLIHTYSVPGPLASSSYLEVALFGDTLFLAAFPQSVSDRNRDKELYRVPANGGYEKITYQSTLLPEIDSNDDRFSWKSVFEGLIPGILSILVLGQALLLFLAGSAEAANWQTVAANPIQNTTVFIGYCAATMLAIMLTRRVAYRRGLLRSQTTAWTVSVLLLSLIAPLSMIAIYRRVQREKCSHCGKQRRVDIETCDHCGESWPRPTPQGILILDEPAR